VLQRGETGGNGDSGASPSHTGISCTPCVRTAPRKLVYPHVYTPIDEVDLTRNYVRRPAGKKRVADEIPDL